MSASTIDFSSLTNAAGIVEGASASSAINAVMEEETKAPASVDVTDLFDDVEDDAQEIAHESLARDSRWNFAGTCEKVARVLSAKGVTDEVDAVCTHVRYKANVNFVSIRIGAASFMMAVPREYNETRQNVPNSWRQENVTVCVVNETDIRVFNPTFRLR